MSLDIIAYDPKKLKERKDKFREKYSLSWENLEVLDDFMVIPSKINYY